MKFPKLFFMEKDGGDGTGGGGTGGTGGAGSGEGGAGEGAGPGATGSGDPGTGSGAGGTGGQGGGSGTQDWRTQFISDEYLRGNPALKDFDSVEGLARNFIDLQSHVGNSIRIPSEDAGPEARKEFYKKLGEKVPGLMPVPNSDDPEALATVYNQLGRPESPDKYVIPDMGEGVDNRTTEQFRDVAHRHGLTQKQFEGIVKDITQANLQGAQQFQAAHDAEMKSLRDQEWGVAYDDNLQLALNVAESTNAPPELVAAIKGNQATAATLKWLYGIGKQMVGEGKPLTSDQNNKDGRMIPSEAAARISEIMNNKQHPYWNPSDPGHNNALKRMLELQKMANPQAATDPKSLRSSFSA